MIFNIIHYTLRGIIFAGLYIANFHCFTIKVYFYRTIENHVTAKISHHKNWSNFNDLLLRDFFSGGEDGKDFSIKKKKENIMSPFY